MTVSERMWSIVLCGDENSSALIKASTVILGLGSASIGKSVCREMRFVWPEACRSLTSPTADCLDSLQKLLTDQTEIRHSEELKLNFDVMLTDLVQEATAQIGLFDNRVEREKRRELMTTLDEVNARIGRGAVFFAAQGIKQPWKMQRGLLSPSYTTRWDELMEVQAK